MLRQGFDQRKDQSYALYQLAQDQLAHTLTPLGVLDKAVTRAIATRLGLVTARKPESQEICFVPDNDYRRFLREYTGLKENPGPIVDREGRVLGTHKGVAFYTVGQRHGLGLSGSQPYYVLEVDAEANRLVVGGREEGLREKLLATEVNLISRTAVPAAGLKVEAKIRYRVPQAGAEIIPHPTDPALVWTRFASPQWAVTPGQSVVWYEKDDDGAGADRYDVVVGGGVIATRARERASQEAEAVGPSARR
jgi:tRNA-specific 2-thiouridylase